MRKCLALLAPRALQIHLRHRHEVTTRPRLLGLDAETDAHRLRNTPVWSSLYPRNALAAGFVRAGQPALGLGGANVLQCGPESVISCTE